MRINLHTHTIFSDGGSNIKAYAEKAKINQHLVLCLTDHDYKMNRKKYIEELLEAELVSKEIGIPIICGLEISVFYEEALLFGKEACINWLERRWGEGITHEETPSYLKEIKARYNCALVLCHPQLNTQYDKAMFESGILSLFDGYEITDHKDLFPPDKIEWLETIMPRAKQYRNFDAHHVDDFEGITNEVNIVVQNENDLIQYLRG